MTDRAGQIAVPIRWRDPDHDPAPWTLHLTRHFGAPSADPLRRAAVREGLRKGDPEADALVDWMAVEKGKGWRLFDQALTRGIDSVDDPAPALRDFFAQIDRRPDWVRDDLLRLGCQAALSVGPLLRYALGSGTLMVGYCSSAIARVLMMTGALNGRTYKRLEETGKFAVDIFASGTVGRFTPGFASPVRVRVMHAMVRRSLVKDPRWRPDDWGLPVNQADMAATALAFSLGMVGPLIDLGVSLTDAEKEGIVHLWRYIGYIMGVEEALLPDSYAQASGLFSLLVRSQPDADDDSRALSVALLGAGREALAGLPQPWGRWLADLDAASYAGFSRHIIGKTAADTLGLPDSGWRVLPRVLRPAIVAANGIRRLGPVRQGFARLRLGQLEGQIRKAFAERKPPFETGEGSPLTGKSRAL
ncbi:oxygenase MpaB family protein [Zavarzinia sp.]|uniref:oxygenase MpaB family protein n=1 Tax=Zavarzinia sp. TaxID=2027920 RepID=UPI003BB60E66